MREIKFESWEQAFRIYGGYKSIERFKIAAKNLYLECGGAMCWRGGDDPRMFIPTNELQKL